MAPAISFEPQLGEDVLATVPFYSKTCRLRFVARFFNHEDLQAFLRSGSQIQVWSDIHLQGRRIGEWGANNFTFLESQGRDLDAFSLDEGNTRLDSAMDRTLSCILEVPVIGPMSNEARYSFTYRIAHPSGELEWLGSYGDNGTVRLEVCTLPPYLHLSSWWSDDGGSLVHRSRSNLEHVKKIKLGTFLRVEQWKVWGIRSDGTILQSSFRNCSSIFFLSLSSAGILLPDAFALVAEDDVSLDLTEDGDILATGTASVVLLPLSRFGEKTSPPTSHLNSQIYPLPEGIMVLPFASNSQKQNPAHALILPISALPGRPLPSILPLSTLRSSLAQESAELCLYANSSRAVHFFVATASQLPIIIPSYGATIQVSPPHSVWSTKGAHTRLTILSPPHAADVSSTSRDTEEALPTPPPSPQIKPIAHLTPFRSEHLNDSTVSISDIGIPSRSDTPDRGYGTFASPRNRPTTSEVAARPVDAEDVVQVKHPSSRFLGILKSLFAVIIVFYAAISRWIFGIGATPATAVLDSSAAIEQPGAVRAREENNFLVNAPPPASVAGEVTSHDHPVASSTHSVVSTDLVRDGDTKRLAIVVRATGAGPIVFLASHFSDCAVENLRVEQNDALVKATKVERLSNDLYLVRSESEVSANDKLVLGLS